MKKVFELVKLKLMRKISEKQHQLIAEYFANIGVAWFAAGVVTAFFVNHDRAGFEILSSIGWGLIFSLVFLGMGTYFVRRAL